jgi:hypothetical protein
MNSPRTEHKTPGNVANPGKLTGAACCIPVELPTYKAAPLQAWGVFALSSTRRIYAFTPPGRGNSYISYRCRRDKARFGRPL